MNAELNSLVVKGLEPTELCGLEPAEDSFLELGKTIDEVPEPVASWDAKQALAGSNVATTGGPTASLKFLASKSSNGWFELVVLEASTPSGIDRAVPLAMQIEVGNGSWESSLVQPEIKGDGGDGKDTVSFDVVIAWHS